MTSKFQELRKAQAKAEESFFYGKGSIEDCNKADQELIDYMDKVGKLREDFFKLEHGNPDVDPCICHENALSAAYQNGFSDNDVEYWEIMLATARDYINGEFK